MMSLHIFLMVTRAAGSATIPRIVLNGGKCVLRNVVHILNQMCQIVAEKWQFSGRHEVEEDPERPQVEFRRRIEVAIAFGEFVRPIRSQNQKSHSQQCGRSHPDSSSRSKVAGKQADDLRNVNIGSPDRSASRYEAVEVTRVDHLLGPIEGESIPPQSCTI
jgi:hypothetical protein